MKPWAAFALLDGRRLARNWQFWVLFLAAILVGAFESWHVSGTPSTVMWLGFFAAYLSSWGLAQDRRSGGLDLLLQSGLSLGALCRLRFALSLGMVGVGLVLAVAPAVLSGGLGLSRALALLPPIVLWAAVGATLGPRVQHQLLVVLLFVFLVLSFFWATSLSVLLLGQAPTAPLSRAVALCLFALGPLPLSEVRHLVSPRWELVRLGAAVLLLASQEALWKRYSILLERQG